MAVTLEQFHVLDWFPRAPGLYHTDSARWVRDEALNYREPKLEHKEGVRREPSAAADYTVVLKPQGKMSMLEGGVASYASSQSTSTAPRTG